MSLRYLKIGFAAGVALIALALYGRTLAPTATLIDSGELITACARLGIGHPPGFPLYILIGWLFAHLPVGSVAVRLNFMSAVFGALATGAVFLLATHALQLKSESKAVARPAAPKSSRKTKASPSPPLAPEIPALPAMAVWDILLPSAVAALTFAVTNTLWSYATVTEVYTLNTFLAAVILGLVLHSAPQTDAGGAAPPAPALARRLYLAAFIFGLALGVHHVSIAFLSAGILYWLIWHRRYFLKTAVVLKSAGWLLLGAGVYLYLPLRAAQKPLLNWGDPSNWERLVWHITGKIYRVNLESTSSERALELLGQFLTLWAREFTYVGFVLLVIGLVALWRHQRRLFWFSVLIVAFNTLWVTFYDIAEDKDAYGLPTFVLSTVWLAYGLRWLIETVRRRRPALVPATALAFLALPAAAMGLHYRHNDHSRYYVAYDYVHNVLDNMEDRGVLLTLDWQLYSPLLYFQHIEGWRPDVTVIDINLLRRSWYVDYLRRQYPALMQEAQEDVQDYLAQLDLFEHDRPYNPQVIQTRFVDLINHLIRASMATRPVYTMLSVQAEPQIAQRLFWVPQGPIFRLYRLKPEYVAPGARRELNLRGLTDGSVPLDDVAQRLRRDYATMLTNRGIYLTLYSLYAEAIPWYQKALALEPRLLDAPWRLAQSYKALGRTAEARQAYEAALALAPDNSALQAEYRSLSP